MDEKDETQIWYNQFGVEMDGETVQSEIGYVQVEGKGESSQEEQLKANISTIIIKGINKSNRQRSNI